MRKFFASGLAAMVLALLMIMPASSASMEPLVSVQWLDSHLREPNIVVLDVRSAIDGGGAEAYQAAHIPGSVHSDYDKDGWRVTRNNIPFMVPTAAELEK